MAEGTFSCNHTMDYRYTVRYTVMNLPTVLLHYYVAPPGTQSIKTENIIFYYLADAINPCITLYVYTSK